MAARTGLDPRSGWSLPISAAFSPSHSSPPPSQSIAKQPHARSEGIVNRICSSWPPGIGTRVERGPKKKKKKRVKDYKDAREAWWWLRVMWTSGGRVCAPRKSLGIRKATAGGMGSYVARAEERPLLALNWVFLEWW